MLWGLRSKEGSSKPRSGGTKGAVAAERPLEGASEGARRARCRYICIVSLSTQQAGQMLDARPAGKHLHSPNSILQEQAPDWQAALELLPTA